MSKNTKIAIIVIVVLIIAFGFWKYYQNKQKQNAAIRQKFASWSAIDQQKFVDWLNKTKGYSISAWQTNNEQVLNLYLKYHNEFIL